MDKYFYKSSNCKSLGYGPVMTVIKIKSCLWEGGFYLFHYN
jgi:hypothetical protein